MRLRLFLSFSLIVVITTAAILILVGLNTANEIRQFADRGGFGGNERLVADLETYYEREKGWEGIESVLRHGPGNGAGGQGSGPLKIADADGKIVFSADNSNRGDKVADQQLDAAILLKDKSGQTIGYFLPAGDLPPRGQVGDSLIGRLNRTVLVATVIGGGTSLLLAFGLTYSLMRPIRALTKASQALADGDMSHRVAVQGDGDIARLATTFNEMAGSLEAAEQRRQDMTADIAHELRTPIAVQRANLEALIDGIYSLSTENLEPILAHSRQLEHLVDDLATLAMADTGQIRLDKIIETIDPTVEQVARQFQAQASDREITLLIHLGAGERAISFDPRKLEQILVNLLSNAFKYTPDGGHVEVATVEDPDPHDTVTLMVRDSGPGIPDQDITRVFERFYRSDQGRARSEGGSGLGLAIARKLAMAHNGSLAAENHPDGGALFKLRLSQG